MKFLEAIGIILGMYTRIPVPAVKWTKENMRYSMCFLALPGIIIGLFESIWFILCTAVEFSPIFYAAFACAIPIFVCGGLHLDGFMDLVDALSARTDENKRQEIMADPHVGAFGVVSAVLYILFNFAAYYEVYLCASVYGNLWALGEDASGFSMLHLPLALLLIYTASRALTAYAIFRIVPSRHEGLLYTFSSVSDARIVRAVSVVVLALCEIAMLLIFGAWALLFALAAILLYFYFKRMAKKMFGGISGDLCGWLIEMFEIIMLVLLVVILEFA